MQAGDAGEGRLSLDAPGLPTVAPDPSRGPQREGRAGLVLLGLALGFAAFARYGLLDVSLERDEGIYAYFGRQILEGATPYVSFYEIKPPGLYYAYAGVVALFGDGVVGLHAGFALINLVTMVVLYRVAARLMRPLYGGVVAASFAVLSLLPGLSGFTAQSEHWIALFASLSLLVSLHALERDSRSLIFGAAILATVAMTIKQSGVLFVAAVGVFALLPRPGLSWLAGSGSGGGRRLGDLAVVGAGAIVVYGGAVAAMVALGAFDEFWFWTVEFPTTYVTQIGAAGGAERFARYAPGAVRHVGALWGLAGLGLVATLLAPGSRLARGVVATFVLASFAAVVPGQRFYGHYWLQAMPALALLVGVGALAVERLARLLWPGMLPGRIAIAVFALAMLQPLVLERAYWFAPDLDALLRRVYYTNPFPEARVVGQYLREHMAPDDELVVIGSEPQLYLYTDRRLASRHAYFEYVIIHHPRHMEWQREFMLDVERTQPEWIVFFDHATSLGGDIDPDSRERFLTWFRRYVERKEYVPVGLADMVELGSTEYIWKPEGLTTELRRQTGKVVVYRRPED